MKFHAGLAGACLVLLLTGSVPLWASANDAEAPEATPEAKQQAYREALEMAEREKEVARQAREKARLARETAEQQRSRTQAEQAEIAAMQRELSRVQEELRQASREVVRAHRELERAQGNTFAFHVPDPDDHAVIGVILGESGDQGVKVLGVSPDGPAERAGIRQGDVIVSVMGKPLAAEGGAQPGQVLLEVMEGVKPGDELEITVRRDEGKVEQTFGVVAAAREPVTWTSMIRLPSAPVAPGAPVIVEHIEVPPIDEVALAEKMQQLEKELGERRIFIEKRAQELAAAAPEAWSFEFENLSELGEEAVLGANVWFGTPMTTGLKLAQVNEELGAYFKTDHGVLVLEAMPENDMQVQAGDVITKVGAERVEKPADVMRALRKLEPGAPLELEIMRNRKSKTLELVVPERSAAFSLAPGSDHGYFYQVTIDED